MAEELDDQATFTELKSAGKYRILKQGLLTPEKIDDRVILDLSSRFQTKGRFESAYLFVSAASDGGKSPLSAGESVYFYVDTSEKGGHLVKERSLLNIATAGATTDLLYRATNIPLTQRPYQETNTPVLKTVDLLDVLNDENGGYYRKHYLGAFVSAMKKPGKLVEIGIAFSCADNSDCNITQIK